jgi:hypothetical protein
MESIESELFGIKKRKQTINSKVKGNRNELKTAQLLMEWTGHEFARVPRSGGLRWRNRMDICGDVINVDPDFEFIFSVETKHVKHLGIRIGVPHLRDNSVVFKYWNQCKRDAEASGKIPMLIIRQNGMPESVYYVFLEMSFFLKMKIDCPVSVHSMVQKIGSTNPSIVGYWSSMFFKRIDYPTLKSILK